MTHNQQVTAVKNQLLRRRAFISRSRIDNDADAVSLGAEKRPEELAENHEISDVLVLLSERENAELQEVNAALQRIDLGTWGKCEKCGTAIASGRMTALPEARTCMRCAS
jgi:DnaK suppressor protein